MISQVVAAADVWQYAGFELDSIFYVWVVLPFG